MNFSIKRLKDLRDFDIASANELWRLSDVEEENSDPTDYDEAATKAYLDDPANIMIAAFVDKKPVGFVLATIVKKPYKDKDFLYIDEVDVHVNYRKQGVGTAMMREVFHIAREEYGLREAWLGTEPYNTAARALYETLDPEEIEQSIGYTFKFQAKF